MDESNPDLDEADAVEQYRRRQARRKLRNQAIIIVLIVGAVALVVYGASAFFQGCPDGVPQITSAEGSLAAHYHVHLDVFVNGSSILVPDTLGHLAGGNLCALHTHDATGVIHIETPSAQNYTIREVLDVWGYSVPSGALVYVSGALSDFSHVLATHEEIAVVIGTPPSTIPSSYNFPSGS